MKPESFIAYYTNKLFGVTPSMRFLKVLLAAVTVNSIISFII